ncbi:MAG: hypothetical protein U9N54_03950 [candidate division Zixibacteria bacterium]|nr:hypothetical protein [candidate division Zixibacteria bacterium]
MNTLDRINRFIGLFLGALRNIFAGRIWLMLFIYLFVNWLILYAHHNFSSPMFYNIISIWSEIFGDKQFQFFTHYSGHFLLLGLYFGWAKFIFGFLFEGLLLGFIAREFYKRYGNTKVKFTKTLKQSWLSLIVGWLVINGLLLIISIGLPELLKDFLWSSPRRQMVFEFLMLPSIFIFVFALFYFVVPGISIYGWSVLKSISVSVKHFISNPMTCLFLAGIVLSGPILISFVNNHPEIIVEKFKPELVYILLIGSLVLDILANFFWIGTSVKFLSEEE